MVAAGVSESTTSRERLHRRRRAKPARSTLPVAVLLSALVVAPVGAAASPAPAGTEVPSGTPHDAGLVSLDAVSVVSARDAWAVGTVRRPGTTLIERWDGKTWSRVDSPNPNR